MDCFFKKYGAHLILNGLVLNIFSPYYNSLSWGFFGMYHFLLLSFFLYCVIGPPPVRQKKCLEKTSSEPAPTTPDNRKQAGFFVEG